MPKITIRDVAHEAGVSISTVSNALNNSNLVNHETKAKIIEVADRLNYIPNLNGKRLKAKKSMMLGFFSSSVTGAYFYILVDAIYHECEKRGYGLNVFATRDKKMIMSNILGGNLDGVIVFEGCRIAEPEIELMIEYDIKTLFLDREYKHKNISSVIFNSYKAGYEAAKYLINLGHKRIYYIEGADDVYDSQQRKKGYLDAMHSMGLPVTEDYILRGMYEERFTYNSVMYLIMNAREILPDAFIAGNDLSAIGCIKALQDRGYSVPEDVNVIGFDDIEIAEYFRPPLSTVRNPIARQGMLAAEILLDMIHENKEGTIKKLEGVLVPRGTTSINLL